MNTYENLTGGARIYLASDEGMANIPQPLLDVLTKARCVRTTVEVVDQETGQVYQIVQEVAHGRASTRVATKTDQAA